jgi:putative transposase
MGAERKWEVIDLVRRSPLSKARTLEELGIPRSTYYRWQRRFRQQGEVGLVDRRPQPGTVWNRLTPQEEGAILREALRQSELSSGELACWVTDHGDFSVSESSAYRVLKRHGLIREVKVLGFPAGEEYQVKTTRINEQGQSDASYFFMVGWGWYYLISVLDDYSRFILAWDLKLDMTAESISEVAQQAVEWTGMEKVPVEDRTRLLSDRGPGFLARALEDYLRMLGDPAYLLLAVPSADQRQAGAVPRDAQGAAESAGVHQSRGSAGGHGGVHRVLQPPSLPRRNRKRHAGRCLLPSMGRNPQTEEGIKAGHHRRSVPVQSGPDAKSNSG